MTTQKVQCNIPIVYLENNKGHIHLHPNKTYSLTIDYPLDVPLVVSIETGPEGMGFSQLLNKIGKSYKKAYENDDVHGIWGHDIGDLVLESVSVNHENKKITLFVGS